MEHARQLTEDTYDHDYVEKHVHRFDEWAQRILGNGPDATPKTPKWATSHSSSRSVSAGKIFCFSRSKSTRKEGHPNL